VVLVMLDNALWSVHHGMFGSCLKALWLMLKLIEGTVVNVLVCVWCTPGHVEAAWRCCG